MQKRKKKNKQTVGRGRIDPDRPADCSSEEGLLSRLEAPPRD
jgi:hypothetical protein